VVAAFATVVRADLILCGSPSGGDAAPCGSVGELGRGWRHLEVLVVVKGFASGGACWCCRCGAWMPRRCRRWAWTFYSWPLAVVVVVKVVVADGPRGVRVVVVLGGTLVALWWPGLDGAAPPVPYCCAL
jgi:hypothetical protein